LFIAYGLTTLPIVRVMIPFLMGRFLSYVLWPGTAAAISAWLDVDDSGTLGYLSVYFVLTQLFLLSIVYVLTRVHWHTLLQEHKGKWLHKS